MIVNASALLAGSVSLLQFLVAATLVAVGVSTYRLWHVSATPEATAAIADRTYLLVLLGHFTAGMAVVSWPLLYLVLQSYIPEWPGVMCIYGVTRIGMGSENLSGLLPPLLQLLQILKPALMFLVGGWWILYGVHRQSQTDWLLRPLILTLMGIGVASSLDAGMQLAYLAIPKKEVFLAAGCCTVPRQSAALTASAGPLEGAPPMLFLGLYYAANGVMLLALQHFRSAVHRIARVPLVLVVVTAVVACSAAALIRVITPVALGGSTHQCVYDLVPGEPHVLLAIGLFFWGTFSAGWAALAGRFARGTEGSRLMPAVVDRALRRSQVAYLCSTALVSLGLVTRW